MDDMCRRYAPARDGRGEAMLLLAGRAIEFRDVCFRIWCAWLASRIIKGGRCDWWVMVGAELLERDKGRRPAVLDVGSFKLSMEDMIFVGVVASSESRLLWVAFRWMYRWARGESGGEYSCGDVVYAGSEVDCRLVLLAAALGMRPARNPTTASIPSFMLRRLSSSPPLMFL